MRLALRFILPLLVTLSVVAAVAQPLFDRLTLRWFVRDLEMRTALIANAFGGSLIDLLRQQHRAEIGRLMERITQDERLFAVGLCNADDVLVRKTPLYPEDVPCNDAARALLAPDHLLQRRGLLHVSAQPLVEEDGRTVARLVFVHDMTFVQRRSDATRKYLFYLFVAIGAVVSLVTVLIAQWSQRGWIAGLRRMVARESEPAQWAERLTAGDLQPVAQDLRALLTEYESGRASRDDPNQVWTEDTLRSFVADQLRGQEIIIVSNREPYIHNRHDGQVELQRPASGLITALEPVARACRGTWIAHGSGNADREMSDRFGRVAVPPENPRYRLRRVWLSAEEETGYYYGFANSGLWPLCHNAHVRPSFLKTDWEAYRAVNRKFAEAVVAEARTADPIVLVQDFHFALLPRLIRQRLQNATIIAFWHIPWPNPEAFGICPWREEILDGLLGSSILGFHTQSHCNNFFDSVDRYLEAKVDRESFTIWFGGEPTAVHRYPISIEWPPAGPALGLPVPDCRLEVRRRLGLATDVRIVLGVDRLDYTKGIVERFLAVERLLETHPEWIGRMVFLQIAAPSRSRIEEYHAFEERVLELVARINGRFRRDDWIPIVLKVEHHEFEQVQYLYRAADVCMVTSLHDGMNLVSKEFVAARDDDGGVLILSQFAGASRELHEALIVNPYDIDQCGAALDLALHMPENEQRARMRNMRAVVQDFNVYRWAGRMLLDGLRMRDRRRVQQPARRPPTFLPPAVASFGRS